MNSETYKIAICDDSQADVEYIAKLVKEWAKDKIVVIKTYPSAEAFMFNYAEEKDFDNWEWYESRGRGRSCYPASV